MKETINTRNTEYQVNETRAIRRTTGLDFGNSVHKATNAARVIKIILCLVSLLSLFSVKALSTEMFNPGMTSASTMFLWALGTGAAWLACPLKLISYFPKLILTGFRYGLFIVGIGCIFGAGFGLILALVVALCFPVVATIPYLLKQF